MSDAFIITDKGIFKVYNQVEDIQVFFPDGSERWMSIHTHINESFLNAVKRFSERLSDCVVKDILINNL